jgi:hypothetical protein
VAPSIRSAMHPALAAKHGVFLRPESRDTAISCRRYDFMRLDDKSVALTNKLPPILPVALATAKMNYLFNLSYLL